MAYCNWDNTSELNLKYHDTEWGIPLWDDRGQFEFLMMEVMQCGLNWNMMIKKGRYSGHALITLNMTRLWAMARTISTVSWILKE